MDCKKQRRQQNPWMSIFPFEPEPLNEKFAKVGTLHNRYKLLFEEAQKRPETSLLSACSWMDGPPVLPLPPEDISDPLVFVNAMQYPLILARRRDRTRFYDRTGHGLLAGSVTTANSTSRKKSARNRIRIAGRFISMKNLTYEQRAKIRRDHGLPPEEPPAPSKKATPPVIATPPGAGNESTAVAAAAPVAARVTSDSTSGGAAGSVAVGVKRSSTSSAEHASRSPSKKPMVTQPPHIALAPKAIGTGIATPPTVASGLPRESTGGDVSYDDTATPGGFDRKDSLGLRASSLGLRGNM